MKKLLLTALLIWGSAEINALPVGNPAEASLVPWGIFIPRAPDCNPCSPCFCWFDIWSLRAGYYGDFVFNRNLKIDGFGHGEGKGIEKTQISTNAGYLALNLADKVDIFGTLGATSISITTNELSWVPLASSVSQIDWRSAFSWSAGARGTLFRYCGLLFGIEGQYFETRAHLNKFVNIFGTPQYYYFNDQNRMNYREWQIGTGVSYALTCFCPNFSLVPYAAAKCSWARFVTDNFSFLQSNTEDIVTIYNLKSSKTWGFAIGVTGTYCDMVCLTVEGRWADEKAFYVNGNFRF